MLECKNISFQYKKQMPWIIKDFCLTIRPGEIIGLMGDSGKGKTTLGKLIAGFLPCSKGNILMDDQIVSDKGYSPVQMIFQHPEHAVNPRWKVKKILSEVQDFFPSDELLYGLSINPQWLHRYPHELSGGELQRIAVARVLNNNTRYIIADEMTSMLDSIIQAQIWNTVLSFSKKNNIGILAISHDKNLLQKICSRTITL